MSSPAASARARFPWLAGLLGLVAFAILIGLGAWQVERLQWKEALIATIEVRTARPTATPTPAGPPEA